jgi:hypothetical protein
MFLFASSRFIFFFFFFFFSSFVFQEMKGKRDRSVAALLVVDMTEERLAGLGAAGLDTVPVVTAAFVL